MGWRELHQRQEDRMGEWWEGMGKTCNYLSYPAGLFLEGSGYNYFLHSQMIMSHDFQIFKSDCDNIKWLWFWNFQLHDWLPFLRHLGLGFLSLATKMVWTKHPPFFFAFCFNHIWLQREPQEEETAADCSPTLIRSKLLLSPQYVQMIRVWETSPSSLSEEWWEITLLPGSSCRGQGDLAATGWLRTPAPGKRAAELPGALFRHIFTGRAQQAPWGCCPYLPTHKGCQRAVYFVTNRQNKLHKASCTQQVRGEV